MHGSGWSDAGVVADPRAPAATRATIADRWNLAVVPQGGIVAVLAARAMAEELGHDEQQLRTFTAVFAGQVAPRAGRDRRDGPPPGPDDVPAQRHGPQPGREGRA